jgi:short-subunit dehydrogenase
MAGLVNRPNMGVYNVSKHAGVSLSKALHQDLRLVTEQVTASVLCSDCVTTGITHSQRNRPAALAAVQTRLEDVLQVRNPTDPFANGPEIGAGLRAALCAAD